MGQVRNSNFDYMGQCLFLFSFLIMIVGSMYRAARGMRDELDSVASAFVLMIGGFVIRLIIGFWMFQSVYTAALCSVVVVIFVQQWYSRFFRIYAKFQWDFNEDDILSGEHHRDDDFEYNMNPAHNHISDSLHAKLIANESSVSRVDKQKTEESISVVVPRTSSTNPNRSRNPMAYLHQIFGPHQSHQRDLPTQQQAQHPEFVKFSLTGTAKHNSDLLHQKDVVMEGYLTKHGANEMMFLGPHLTRRYFVLTVAALLYYYENRQVYRNTSSHPMKDRPIVLYDYNIETTEKLEIILHHSSESEFTASTTGRSWHLQADNQEELDLWVSAMRDVCPSSFLPTRVTPSERYQA